MKPSDRWCISLCRECHSTQHQMGEASFEKDRLGGEGALWRLAQEFARKSPHWPKLRDMP